LKGFYRVGKIEIAPK